MTICRINVMKNITKNLNIVSDCYSSLRVEIWLHLNLRMSFSTYKKYTYIHGQTGLRDVRNFNYSMYKVI